MCGRTVVIDPEAIGGWFEIEHVPEGFLVPRYNVAPSQPIPVVRSPHRLELLRWGIAREGRPPQINTRVESIARTVAQQRRCLVAADGFYEWKRTGTTSQPYLLRETDGNPFAIGAVWSSSVTEDGEVVDSVSLLTCSPQPPVAAIHDRMPLVIPREAYARWLDPAGDVRDLLAPTATRLVATSVSAHVNSPKNDDPKCIEPASPIVPSQRSLF